ncbi:hypothetical protein VPH35_041331 [Triticum aestivum]
MIRAWRWIAAYICYPHYHFLDHSMDGLLQIHVVVAGSCRPSLVLASHQDRLRLVHADVAVAPCGAPLMLHLLPRGLLWLPPLHPGNMDTHGEEDMERPLPRERLLYLPLLSVSLA